MVISIPDERLNQVAAAMRAAANQFHGAATREPGDKFASQWRETALFFDNMATDIYRAASSRGDTPLTK